MNRKLQTILILIILIFVFVLMFLLNSNTHHFHDEFVFSTVYGEVPSRIANNLSDVLISLKNMYLMHTGRIIVHGILSVLLILNKTIFNILNSLVFTILCFILMNLATKKEKSLLNRILIIILIFPMLWETLPVFSETILWTSGALNYLWPAVFTIFYINVHFEKLEGKRDKKSDKYILPILGLIGGLLHEVVGVVVVSTIFFVLVYEYIKLKKINFTFLSSMISTFIGFLLILLAPGTSARNELATAGNMEYTLISGLRTAFDNFMQTINLNIVMFIVIAICIILFLIKIIKNRKILMEDITYFKFFSYIFSATLVYIAMIVSKEFFMRVCFIPYILFVLAFFEGISVINIKYVKEILLTLLIIVFSYNAYFSILETVQLSKKQYSSWEQREEYIQSEVEKGNKDIYVDKFDVETNTYTYYGEISTSKSYTANKSMATYYGLDSIRINKNYYLDLNLVETSNKGNNKSISISDGEITNTQVFFIIDKNVYDIIQKIEYKKGRYTYNGGNIVLYYYLEKLDEILVTFDKDIKELNINNMKIYDKESIIYNLNPEHISNIITNMNDIEIKEVSSEKISIEVKGENPNFTIKLVK